MLSCKLLGPFSQDVLIWGCDIVSHLILIQSVQRLHY